MAVIDANVRVLRGTPYKFQKWIFRASSNPDRAGSLLAKFSRSMGLYDFEVTQENTPDNSFCTVLSLRDRWQGNVGMGIAESFRRDGVEVLLYPPDELHKAMNSVPHDLAPHDDMATRYFSDRHKWPYKPLDYKGLQLIK